MLTQVVSALIISVQLPAVDQRGNLNGWSLYPKLLFEMSVMVPNIRESANSEKCPSIHIV